MSTTTATPPVVATIPADVAAGGVEVLVRHEFGKVWVDVRTRSRDSWTPLELVGGSFEVRAS